MLSRSCFAFLLLFVPTLASGQPLPAPEKEPAPAAGKKWRDTTGYRFPALATTVAAAQNMAYAMTLRDYCANSKLTDDFVRERLNRFGRITGREETCQSLRDY